MRLGRIGVGVAAVAWLFTHVPAQALPPRQILASAAISVLPVNLFGEDTRRAIEPGSAEDDNFSAVGVISRDGHAEATGFLLGRRDLFVTTAHSFFSRGRFKSGRFDFLPAGHIEHRVSIAESDIVAIGTRSPRREPWRDWAVVRLSRPVPIVYQPLTFAPLAADYVSSDAHAVRLIAFHRDRIEIDHLPIRYISENCSLQTKGAGDHFSDIDDIFLHDCDFDVISSGGPIVARIGESFAAVGINAGFFTPFPDARPPRLVAFSRYDGRINPNYSVRFQPSLVRVLERLLGGRLS